MEHGGDGRHFVSLTDSEIPTLHSGIKGTHVIADGKKLRHLQLFEKPLQDDAAFFTVADGEALVDLIDLLLYPFAAFILDIAVALLIEIYLAHVVEKRRDRHGLGGNIFVGIIRNDPFQAIVDVQGMLQKPARVVAVIFCAGGRLVKVAFLQPVKKLIQALALDLTRADIKKTLFICQSISILPPAAASI